MTVETEPAAAAAAAAEPAPKQWKIAEVPEGADPLDYINMEKLKEDNKNLPTTKEGIAKFLNEMPITADVMPGQCVRMRTEPQPEPVRCEQRLPQSTLAN